MLWQGGHVSDDLPDTIRRLPRIDSVDTLDEGDDWGGPTPIEMIVERVERDIGRGLEPGLRRLAEAMWRHGRRDQERTADRIMQVAASQPPGAVIAAEVSSLRARMHDVERVAADAMGGHAIHGERDRAEFARLDADVVRLIAWQHKREQREAAEAEKTAKGHGKLYGAIVGAAIPGLIALVAFAAGYGAKGERFDALVETVRGHAVLMRDLDEKLDELQADLFRARLRNLPGFTPAPSPGD